MHYYNFNVADYRKDTGHLDPIEHYIYRFLMDSYYLNEGPIAIETQSVMRRLRLDSDCLEQLKNVLNDFFVLADDGWHHKRIDSEISDYHDKCSKNAINGKKGGRPKKQQLTGENKPKKTQSVNLDNPTESELKPNQEPRTNNQEPLTNLKDNGAKAPKFNFKKSVKELGVDESILSDWLLVRKRKKATNTETAFKLLLTELGKTSLSANEAIKLAAGKGWAGFESEWARNLGLGRTKNKPVQQSFADKDYGEVTGSIL